MRRWVDRNWYRYLAYRFGVEGLVAASIVGLTVLGLAGFFAARALPSGDSSTTTGSYVPLTRTVMRRVAVVRRGKTVYKRVPVVKRVYARPVTVQETRTISTPGGTKVVTRPVVRYQTVYRRRVVLVHGKPVTLSRVVTDTRMLTATQPVTVTNERTNTVVNEHTNTVVTEHTNTVVQQQTVSKTQTVSQTVTNVVTNVRTETLPPQTVTVTGPTQTQVVTTTVESTVTAPPDTVTVTVSRPDH
jgi:hypothetical protein